MSGGRLKFEILIGCAYQRSGIKRKLRQAPPKELLDLAGQVLLTLVACNSISVVHICNFSGTRR